MLEKLTLADNFLEMIPNGRFDDLRSLVLLDMSSNLITSIAVDAFNKLKSLKSLKLNDNCLTDVTLNFDISALHEINLSTNFINNFPRLYVQSVGTLNLSNNSMEAVNFEKITTIVESLIVADNKINRIDNYGNNNSNNTNNNNTNTIVKSIRLFNFEGNQLSDVNQLPKLSRALDINLSRNPFDYSQNIRFLKRFDNVKRLNLTDTNLTTSEIFHYIDGKQLDELSIARNPLKVDFEVLQNFTQLKKLQFQQLSCYKFDCYRPIIRTFSHMKELTIHYELSSCECVKRQKKLFTIFGHVQFTTDWGVLCSGGTSAFFGLNVRGNYQDSFSASTNKVSSSITTLLSTFDSMLLVTEQSKSETLVEAGKGISSLQYYMVIVQKFYMKLSTAAFDTQSESSTLFANLLNDVEFIIFAHESVRGSSELMGAAFGEKVQKFMVKTLSSFEESSQKMKETLTMLAESIQAFEESGVAVNTENILTDVDIKIITTFTQTTTVVFEQIQQIQTVQSSILVNVQSLDGVTKASNVAVAYAKYGVSTAQFWTALYDSASKSAATRATTDNTNSVKSGMSYYQNLLATTFTSDAIIAPKVAEESAKIDDYINGIATSMTTAEATFSVSMETYKTEFKKSVEVINTSVQSYSDQIAVYMAMIMSENSGTFSKCANQYQRTASYLVYAVGNDASKCVNNEMTLSYETQSEMTFKLQDVALNSAGAVDEMCGCTIKGGKKVNKKSLKCIKKITDSLEKEELTEDTKHIEEACTAADEKLMKGPMRLLECGEKVTSTFDASFETFKKTFESCLLA
ncbi:unnamed protein product [Diamesa hyperborea]